MILRALEGKPLPIYGNGGNVRDWLYVDDHARALKRVFESGTSGEITASAATTSAPTSKSSMSSAPSSTS